MQFFIKIKIKQIYEKKQKIWGMVLLCLEKNIQNHEDSSFLSIDRHPSILCKQRLFAKNKVVAQSREYKAGKHPE